MKLITPVSLIFLFHHVTNSDVNRTTVAETSKVATSHISSVKRQKLTISTESNVDTSFVTNSTETSAIENTGTSYRTPIDISSLRESMKFNTVNEETSITTSLPASKNVDNITSKIPKANSNSMKSLKTHSTFQSQTQDEKNLETSSNGGTIAIVVIVIILILIICAYIYYKKYYQTRYTFLHNFVN